MKPCEPDPSDTNNMLSAWTTVYSNILGVMLILAYELIAMIQMRCNKLSSEAESLEMHKHNIYSKNDYFFARLAFVTEIYQAN